MSRKNIFIAGAGGIGTAAGLILAENPEIDCHIYIADQFEQSAIKARNYINQDGKSNKCTALQMPSEGLDPNIRNILSECDIILDCLPGSQAPRIAGYARQFECHYANLTEYVNETEQVTKIASGARQGFILQTGLAPGYINVLAMHLFKKFTSRYNVEKVDEINMKVGALSKHARSPYFYAYTWSPIGVATEYVKDAFIVDNYQIKKVPSLSLTETLLIDGVAYEDDFTSGGAADLPYALSGKVRNLNYKTLRYPGHYSWAKQIISETPAGIDSIAHINKVMMENIPVVENDFVVVFASVKAKDHKNVLRAMEKSIKIYPSRIGNHTLRAIQTTTAAPLCEAARLLLSGKYSGPVFQSQIEPLEFLNGPFVNPIYGEIE